MLTKMVITTEILTMKKNKKKSIEQKLGCEFIKLDPDEEDCDSYLSKSYHMKYFGSSNNLLIN